MIWHRHILIKGDATSITNISATLTQIGSIFWLKNVIYKATWEPIAEVVLTGDDSYFERYIMLQVAVAMLFVLLYMKRRMA